MRIKTLLLGALAVACIVATGPSTVFGNDHFGTPIYAGASGYFDQIMTLSAKSGPGIPANGLEGGGIGMMMLQASGNHGGAGGIWSDNVFSTKIIGNSTQGGDIAMITCSTPGSTDINPSTASPIHYDNPTTLGHAMAAGASGWSGTSAIAAPACGDSGFWFQPDA
jgi:hypothetical protein